MKEKNFGRIERKGHPIVNQRGIETREKGRGREKEDRLVSGGIAQAKSKGNKKDNYMAHEAQNIGVSRVVVV